MLMQTHESRLAALRKALNAEGLAGFVVPISDEHMSEYVGEYAQRLKWLTGFGGSAGQVIVLADKAAIFVDGRYTEQVRDQVDARLFSYEKLTLADLRDWLAANAREGDVIGYDPWLHGKRQVAALQTGAEKAGASLRAVAANPVDGVWQDQPQRSPAPLVLHPAKFAGREAADKVKAIADWLTEQDLDATVMTALDSVAWTFNIRGADISHIPVALAYARIARDGSADLFVDPAKLTDDVRGALSGLATLHDYGAFGEALTEMRGLKVAADPDSAPAAIFEALQAGGADIHEKRDPAILMKAIKNDTEIAGAIAAHERDGVALTRFLKWMNETAPKGGVDELSAAAKLRAFRDELDGLKDLSFPTISATGPHGALPHYSVDEDSNAPVEPGQLYLVDSGGQYLDGTTDVTRVVAIGEPSDEMRRRYTQVLKGHIALDRALFPKGTSGVQLDVLARQYLWADGTDFAHGTGHGVGSYLAVHEGPQRISKGGEEPLVPGMIVSNEPGYYKSGGFGIRIENLVLVEEREVEGGEQPMLGFRALTLAPLEPALIDTAMLTADERGWIDAYHARVAEVIGPQLDGEERAWLERVCAPISA